MQLTLAISFISCKVNDEVHIIYLFIYIFSKLFMIYDNADEVIEELFESVLNRYQIGVETSIKCNDFFFDYVNLLD